MITLRPLKVRATCKPHYDQPLLETSCLQKHRELTAFEIKFRCIRRCKVKLDTPEHTATTDIKSIWRSDGIMRLQLFSKKLREVLALGVGIFKKLF